jgi:hypothetical protein
MHPAKAVVAKQLTSIIKKLDAQENAIRNELAQTASRYRDTIPQQWYADKQSELHAISEASAWYRDTLAELTATDKQLSHYKLFTYHD